LAEKEKKGSLYMMLCGRSTPPRPIFPEVSFAAHPYPNEVT